MKIRITLGEPTEGTYVLVDTVNYSKNDVIRWLTSVLQTAKILKASEVLDVYMSEEPYNDGR